MAETAKIRVVVMYGGKADEHSISCISTAGVLRALDTDRFEPVPVGITKQGQWIVDGEDRADGIWPTVCRSSRRLPARATSCWTWRSGRMASSPATTTAR